MTFQSKPKVIGKVNPDESGKLSILRTDEDSSSLKDFS